jgi:hypothetical protein
VVIVKVRPWHAVSLDERLYTDNHVLGATSPSIRRDWKAVAAAPRIAASLNDEEDQEMERIAGEEWHDEILLRLPGH